MMTKDDYKPIHGFYDLRAYDIPEATFMKLWKIQRFLKEVEQFRRNKLVHPQHEEVKELSADYQHILSQYNLKHK